MKSRRGRGGGTTNKVRKGNTIKEKSQFIGG